MTTPSTGTLFFLYGDHVVAPAGMLGGTTVPYSGVKVSSTDLAALVFAASFWHLRQSGALQLAPTTTKTLGMFSSDHVQLTMGTNRDLRTGYEDVIMRAVSGGKSLAHDVVRDWFQRDVKDPEGQVFGIAQQEMLELGLAQSVDAERGAVGGFLLGKTRIEPDRERIQTVWGDFWSRHEGWKQFWAGEQPLAHTLVESCRKAIRGREEHDQDF